MTSHSPEKHGSLSRETRACGVVWHVMTAVTRLASVAQHRPRREDDGIRHENDKLPGRNPAHVAERQLEAVPDERHEQHVDVLQVFPHRNNLLLSLSTLLFWRSFHLEVAMFCFFAATRDVWWEWTGSASQNTNDLAAACLNSHHFENSE